MEAANEGDKHTSTRHDRVVVRTNKRTMESCAVVHSLRSFVRSFVHRQGERTNGQRERTTVNDHGDLPLPSFLRDVMNDASCRGDIEEFRIAGHTTIP